MVRLGLVVALIALWCGQALALERPQPMGLYAGGAPLAMLDSRIEVTVRGPIVEAVVVQRFRNTSGRATEATYIFPLPADAAVSAMAMQIGTRTIHAAIEPRDAAVRRYEAAVAAGVAAARVDQERPDVFTQNVAAIPAGGVVEVTLRYDALARYEAGVWQLVVPMVVAPRYVPGTASGQATTGSGRAPDTDRAPDASRITPAAAPGVGGPTQLAIHFVDEPGELTSPSHTLGGSRRDATLVDAHSDHDAIVRWRAPAASAGWVEREGDAGFAAVAVEAPPAAAQRPPVRAILAIDRAATTRGDGDAVAHPLVRALLGSLGNADRVRLIDSASGWTAPAAALAAVERAWATPPAVFDLTHALEAARTDGAAIILISDGLVADDPAAIGAARRLGVPVHVVGIGPAPARAALQQLAAATAGTLRFAVAGDDLAVLARGVLGDVASPPAPLAVHWGTLDAADVEPVVLPRLGAGQAMLVVARIKQPQAANARVRGELFAFEALGPSRAVDGAITSHGPLARRWARERLGDLLARSDRAAATNLALAYGLVSPYTSLVAVGTDVVVQGGVTRSVAVPVSLPAGMQWRAVQQAIELESTMTGAAPVIEHQTTGKTPAADRSGAPDHDKEDAFDERKEKRAAKSDDDDSGATGGDENKSGDNKGAYKGKLGPLPKPSKKPPAPAKPARGADQPPPPPSQATKPPSAIGKSKAPRHASDDSPADDARIVDDADNKPAEPTTPPVGATAPAGPAASAAPAPAAPPPALTDEELAKLSEAEKGEQIVVQGRAPTRTAAALEDSVNAKTEAISITGGSSPLRLAVSLAGGLAIDHGGHGLVALDARLDHGYRTRLGLDASLWLADGLGTTGRGLVTLAKRFAPVELGVGAGLQLGNGTGPAGSLQLRVDTPLPWLTAMLRYDAALLFTQPVSAEHVLTLGLELSY